MTPMKIKRNLERLDTQGGFIIAKQKRRFFRYFSKLGGGSWWVHGWWLIGHIKNMVLACGGGFINVRLAGRILAL